MQLITATTSPLIKGFDYYGIVSADMASTAQKSGYSFAIRYVDNLSATEIAQILAAGLALMLVKAAPPSAGYTPALGTQDGITTASLASTLAIPSGMCIFVDLENVGTSKLDAAAYLQNWITEVEQGGYVPGLYVGTTMFSSIELYEDFGFQHYWQAGAMNLPFVAKRGYQLYQRGQAPIGDVTVDVDFAQTDLLGGTPPWLSNS